MYVGGKEKLRRSARKFICGASAVSLLLEMPTQGFAASFINKKVAITSEVRAVVNNAQVLRPSVEVEREKQMLDVLGIDITTLWKDAQEKILRDVREFCSFLDRYGVYDLFIEYYKKYEYSEAAFSKAFCEVMKNIFPVLKTDATFLHAASIVENYEKELSKKYEMFSDGLKPVVNPHRAQDIVVLNLKLRVVQTLIIEGKAKEAEKFVKEHLEKIGTPDEKELDGTPYFGTPYAAGERFILPTLYNSSFVNAHAAYIEHPDRAVIDKKEIVVGGPTTRGFEKFNVLVNLDLRFRPPEAWGGKARPISTKEEWLAFYDAIAKSKEVKIKIDCPGADPERKGRYSGFTKEQAALYSWPKIKARCDEFYFAELCKEKLQYIRYSFLGCLAYTKAIEAVGKKGMDFTVPIYESVGYSESAKRVFLYAAERTDRIIDGYYAIHYDTKKKEYLPKEISETFKFLETNNIELPPEDKKNELISMGAKSIADPAVKDRYRMLLFSRIFEHAIKEVKPETPAMKVKDIVYAVRAPMEFSAECTEVSGNIAYEFGKGFTQVTPGAAIIGLAEPGDIAIMSGLIEIKSEGQKKKVTFEVNPKGYKVIDEVVERLRPEKIEIYSENFGKKPFKTLNIGGYVNRGQKLINKANKLKEKAAEDEKIGKLKDAAKRREEAMRLEKEATALFEGPYTCRLNQATLWDKWTIRAYFDGKIVESRFEAAGEYPMREPLAAPMVLPTQSYLATITAYTATCPNVAATTGVGKITETGGYATPPDWLTSKINEINKSSEIINIDLETIKRKGLDWLGGEINKRDPKKPIGEVIAAIPWGDPEVMANLPTTSEADRKMLEDWRARRISDPTTPLTDDIIDAFRRTEIGKDYLILTPRELPIEFKIELSNIRKETFALVIDKPLPFVGRWVKLHAIDVARVTFDAKVTLNWSGQVLEFRETNKAVELGLEGDIKLGERVANTARLKYAMCVDRAVPSMEMAISWPYRKGLINAIIASAKETELEVAAEKYGKFVGYAWEGAKLGWRWVKDIIRNTSCSYIYFGALGEPFFALTSDVDVGNVDLTKTLFHVHKARLGLLLGTNFYVSVAPGDRLVLGLAPTVDVRTLWGRLGLSPLLSFYERESKREEWKLSTPGFKVDYSYKDITASLEVTPAGGFIKVSLPIDYIERLFKKEKKEMK